MKNVFYICSGGFILGALLAFVYLCAVEFKKGYDSVQH
jgi:hypothetical protein